MPKCQDIEVWIEMEGVRLDEYKVETNQEGTQVECWVPCEAGKEFQIGTLLPSCLATASGYVFSFVVDGEKICLRGNVLLKQNFPGDRSTHFKEKNFQGGTIQRALQFGTIELTDDETCLGTGKAFGEISVTLKSVENFIKTQPPSTPSTPTPNDYRVHEHSKKGLSHCVKLGEERPYQGKHPLRFYRSLGVKDICTFIFKYRHLDILIADGIAPHKTKLLQAPLVSNNSPEHSNINRQTAVKRKAPSVKEEKSDKEIVDTTDEEICKLKAQLAALEAKKASDSGKPSKRVKGELKSAFIPGEVIDLTV